MASLIVGAKKELRKRILGATRALTAETVKTYSKCVWDRVFSLSRFVEAQAVCLYVSLPSEVSTAAAFERREGRQLFVPVVTGKGTMSLVSIGSEEDAFSFPKSSWGIPEPPLSSLAGRVTAQHADPP
jgi:5,10-methenyltetrahydrofolate synthetase